MKRITVIPAAGGPYHDITLKPGTTPRDIIRQLALSDDHVLTRGTGTEPIPNDENLFETTLDGSKLYLTTRVDVGRELV